MIEWSLDAFRAADSVGSIVIAAPPDRDYDLGGPDSGADVQVVVGGATRAESVANALAAVETELVAVHDAARPLLTTALIDELVARLDSAPAAAGVVAAAPMTDTVKQAAAADEGSPSNAAFLPQEGKKAQLEVERTVDRSRLWAAQTPQVFRTNALRAALEVDIATRDAATDEAMLVESAGGTVLIQPAPAENLKVTTPLDLRLAELLLAERSVPE